jgi:hypothetical protein
MLYFSNGAQSDFVQSNFGNLWLYFLLDQIETYTKIILYMTVRVDFVQ